MIQKCVLLNFQTVQTVLKTSFFLKLSLLTDISALKSLRGVWSQLMIN